MHPAAIAIAPIHAVDLKKSLLFKFIFEVPYLNF
jgi:hypothetical protein